MSEDIRVMTAQLAADPTSLVFLPLGESLRRRGQREAATKVALAGLSRYPDLADAHDLYARILGDQGDMERAFDEWDIALRLEPMHHGAHKGIGFLYFVAGELPLALTHLEAAEAAQPGDAGVVAAIARVREALDRPAGAAPAAEPEMLAESAPIAAAAPEAPPAVVASDNSAETAAVADESVAHEAVFAGLEGAENGLLLLDARGQRLGGGLEAPTGADVADAVAAHLAGVSREANRAARLLQLGQWQSLAVEAEGANLFLVSPVADHLLLLVRPPHVPVARLGVLAGRAAEAARRWFEELA